MNTKCPDRQLLSVYFDGEMPSPWKEKMESHVAGCSRCARRLQAYRDVSLAANDAETVGAAQERVWQKLVSAIETADAAPLGDIKTPDAGPGHKNIAHNVWRRRISIPLPAAAAAIVLFVLAAFFLALRIAGNIEASDMTLASGTDLDVPGIIPIADISDMQDVLQYLGSRDNGDIIIIRLPESRNFVNYGEPAIIKASDYSRQVMGRQHGRQMPFGRQIIPVGTRPEGGKP